MDALIRFLAALSQLAVMKNGGQENDLSRLLKWAHLGARAGNTGKQHLAAAAAKVEQLVAEDRAMTDQELADLDASIRNKLARAAAVVLPEEQADPAPAPEPEPESAGGTDPT